MKTFDNVFDKYSEAWCYLLLTTVGTVLYQMCAHDMYTDQSYTHTSLLLMPWGIYVDLVSVLEA